MKTTTTSTGAPWKGRISGRLARALVFLLAQALVLQPAAFAATWNIAQQPLFTINPVFPNAVFMLDDSWSMNDYRLPPPIFFSFNNRWPAPGNVTVQYGAGTRSVAAHNEFTLRSSIHNPLAYDPSITYTPWNDNDKPLAAQGTRPTRAQNFPPADIGGAGAVATVGRFTERDMRFRGFANANPNAARTWVTTARGTVGSNGTYVTGAVANDQWTWHPTNLRWEAADRQPGRHGNLPAASIGRFPGSGPLYEPAAGLQRDPAVHPVELREYEPVCADPVGPDGHDAAVRFLLYGAGVRQCLHAVPAGADWLDKRCVQHLAAAANRLD